ncbi:MAG: PDZ domain-containing protein [Myxococcota bacterium]
MNNRSLAIGVSTTFLLAFAALLFLRAPSNDRTEEGHRDATSSQKARRSSLTASKDRADTDDHDDAEQARPPGGVPSSDDGAGADGAGEDGEAEAEEPVDAKAALQAELKTWEEAGAVHAKCTLNPPLEAAEGYLAIGGHSSFNGRRVIVLDGEAHLPILKDYPTDGLLSVEGYAPSDVTWELPEDGMGRCTAQVDLKPGGTVITGVVRHEETGAPAPDAWVEGCGNFGWTDDEGVYYLEAVAVERCTLIAMRQDGKLRTLSQPIEVSPRPGQDLVVDLEISGIKKAGLGIQFTQTDVGMEIEGLLPGGSAEAAGLEAGDVIVAIDGESVLEMEMGEFAEAVGGEAGTEITLSIADAGEEDGARDLIVERQPIE